MSFVEARQHLNGIQLVKFWGVRGMGEGTVKKQFFRVYQFFCTHQRFLRALTFLRCSWIFPQLQKKLNDRKNLTALNLYTIV